MDNSVIYPQLSTGCVDGQAKTTSAQVLLVFAKQPISGQVKTRLTPPLTGQQAATLYAFAQGETVQQLQHVNYSTVICYSGEKDYFQQRYPKCRLIAQGVGDLGQRLQRIFSHQFNQGVDKLCVVGTDSPDLPLEWVLKAFDQLSCCDAVTIPALDGGYVLLGARRDCAPLFEQISWSSAEVLQQTRQRAKESGYSYREIDQWQDIDDLPSLCAFIERSGSTLTGRYAQRCLRSLSKD